MNMRPLQTLLIGLVLLCIGSYSAAEPLRVGSKNFNENYILAEILSLWLEHNGISVERKFGLGGTLICFEALKNGEIDVYVEYTGTLSQAILNLPVAADRQTINAALEEDGLRLLQPFGFNNTYAIAVRDADAQRFNLSTIGDLNNQADLRMVFSHEFLERNDGWPGLSRHYGLDFSRAPQGIEHGLAYQAISDGAIDVTDVYSTDGELVRYNLAVLADDKGYFPSYFAAPLVHGDTDQQVADLLARVANTLNDSQMQQLNAAVVFEGQSFAEVARQYWLDQGEVLHSAAQDSGIWADLLRNTIRHLQLTGIALAAAVLVGLGLSLNVYRHQRTAAAVIYVSGLLQTIPSIALLALMIPLFGIGVVPAIVALFLYSLLPILRNAITALSGVDPTLVRVATALGLTQRQRLRYVLVPISLPAIFAGIKTAAVISIGTATLAAFIGAGGLGDPIVVGLSLDNPALILQGAIPAALLAILTEILFGSLERLLTKRHAS